MATDITSLAWGNKSFPISQEHGVPGFRPDWYTYSSDYGYPGGYHLGLDVPMPRGTPIYALSYGEVIQDEFSDSFRPYPVWIKTRDNPSTSANEEGYVEIYGHLSQEVVQRGQQVVPGQLIGYSGEQTQLGTTTPDGSGPHIHFELRKPDDSTPSGFRAIDPTNWLKGASGTLDNSSGQSGNGGDNGRVITGITDVLGEVGRRIALITIGLVLFFIGVNAVLDNRGTQSITRVAKKAIPVARVVKK